VNEALRGEVALDCHIHINICLVSGAMLQKPA